jgi:biopolymer transport protein ExbB
MLLEVLCVACLSAGGFPQGPSAAAETIGRLSVFAEEQLAGSNRALSELRDAITAEKLPLEQELTKADEKVSALRRENDRVQRLIDAGNLDTARIKAETKIRQDELAYIGNLLDEYARSFEAKVNISELQYCGDAIAAAKQATENTELSLSDKLARQVDAVNVSLQRLSNAIGGMCFPGSGVDLQGGVVDGRFAIIGPVALFCATGIATAGLVVAQSGSTKPLIRPLSEPPLQAGIESLVQRGEGILPLDPSLGGALEALVQKTNLIHVFEKGGPIMWPLLFASVLAFGTVIERCLFLLNERRKRDPKALEQLFAEVQKGEIDDAVRTSQQSRFYVVRTLGYALEHRRQPLASTLMYAQNRELKRFRRGVPILDTVITVAPLLGLLGTVTGMMGSFSLIGGELSTPGAITGGIAEALIATAFGLGIAITALLPFNFLNARLDEARHELESAGSQLELLMHGTPGNPATAAAPDFADAIHPGPHLVATE